MTFDPPLEFDGEVAAWLDQPGSGRDFVQPDPEKRPTFDFDKGEH